MEREVALSCFLRAELESVGETLSALEAIGKDVDVTELFHMNLLGSDSNFLNHLLLSKKSQIVFTINSGWVHLEISLSAYSE